MAGRLESLNEVCERVAGVKDHTKKLCWPFAMLNLDSRAIWQNMLEQSMKERSNLNVTFATVVLNKRVVWKNMFQQCMKERNNSNVTFVMLKNQNRACRDTLDCNNSWRKEKFKCGIYNCPIVMGTAAIG